MVVVRVCGSVGSTIVKEVTALLKAGGQEFEFVPVGMAAGQKARYSSLDSFGEVPFVEEDGDLKLADLNRMSQKKKVLVISQTANNLRSTAHPDLVASGWIEQPVSGLKQLVPAVVVPNLYPSCVSTVNLGVDSPSKYMGVESFDHVDSLQRHVKAKCCCRFGLSKCMGVDSFEHSCVDVHACYKGTLPWPAPRGPRISKLSRTDTATAAPAPAPSRPSRPFSFRASLTLSLSVFFE